MIFQVADAESIIQSLTVFTFIKSKSKAITEDEILRLKDPHVAQDDWVVETGELPPIRDRKVRTNIVHQTYDNHSKHVIRLKELLSFDFPPLKKHSLV